MTLRELMESGPVGWQRALMLVRDIASAIVAVKFRVDVRPQKIAIDPVQVSEDVVREYEPDRRIVVNEPVEYFAPERLMGKELDDRHYVYSLGVIAYELVTAQHPFPDARGPAMVITAQLKQTPAPPSTIRAVIPPEVDSLLVRCLHKDRRERPDLATLVQELSALLTAN